jgi:expansin (peptidoglycan-binding protein)
MAASTPAGAAGSGEKADNKPVVVVIDDDGEEEIAGTSLGGDVETVGVKVVAKLHSSSGTPDWSLVIRASGRGRSMELEASVSFNAEATPATVAPAGSSPAGSNGNDQVPTLPPSEPPEGKPDPGVATPDSPESAVHHGEATCSTFTVGSCGFPLASDDLVGAMNMTDLSGSAACGSCVRVYGPDGSVDVRIVDGCGSCQPGGIDLTMSAFAKIAPLVAGRVPVTWQYIACPVSGPVVYHFSDASGPYWTALQIRDHRYAVDSVEAKLDGAWLPLTRDNANYFVTDVGLGDGPYSFRITDVLGHVLEDSGIPLIPGGDAVGAAQFPSS